MATNRLHQDYTVAWLCALPCEMAAAEAILDEKHSDLPTATEDGNAYVLGRVFRHNVVIACCRSGVYGTTSASACAIQLQATFKSIRFFLLVGIGGGAPTGKADIRLGDVVVSKPTRDFGGVVQYDYGKTINGGGFEHTGVLNKPQSVLLTALARLEAAHKLASSKIPALLSEMRERYPRMRKSSRYPGKDQDILFKSEYGHCEPEETCDICCDTSRQVFRAARPDCGPIIHYGLIASGNQVIKHAQTRDRLARELGILCFEMEAAGVMDHFQCLVVRGICDYSDSHKNKQWQEYAAATAAAFAKELLSVVHTVQMVDAPLAQSDVSHYRGIMPGRGERTTTDMTVHGHDAGDLAKLVSRISNYDEKKVHRRLLQKRLVGTTQWFLDHPDFKAWFNDRTISSLWCSGKIGSGKTMIATTAVEATMYRSTDNRSPTAFFYCETDLPRTLVDTYILSSLIKQLCEFLHLTVKPFPRDITSELRKFFGPDRIQPDWMDLAHIFTLLFDLVPDSVYIVDGLDAMDQKYSKSLLELFHSLFRRTRSSNGPRLLLFSRDQVPGYINISTFVPGICRISTSTNVQGDIERYIDTSITDKSLYRRLTDNLSLMEQVKQTLLHESSEMFLWVYLQLEILWDTCHTDAEIRTSLTILPKGLEEVYRRCIDRITRRHSFAPKVLKWVSFAIRPLHIDELREAVSFGLEDTKWNDERMPQKDVLIGCCANLVIVDNVDNCARFAHSSVKQYLERHLAGEDPSNRHLEYPDAKRGNLECGELCVAYLSFSDFSLQLTKNSTEKAELAVPSPALLVHQALSRYPRTSSLFSWFWTRNRRIPLSLSIIRGPPPPDPNRYKFLNYAVTHWALHTKDLALSVTWKKLESLATRFNETWDIHPWTSGGRSYDSRLHGLFGWAVKEQHEPLLTIALATGEASLRICDLPLIGESLPALHVASKLGYTRITQILLDFCTVNLPDIQGYTALHYAVNGGHIEICRVLLATEGVDVEAISKSECTPLSLAASHGNDEIVALILQTGAYAPGKYAISHSDPLLEAARNGHHKVVSLCIDHGANLECKDIDDRTALSWAAENGHEAVIEPLTDNGGYINTTDDEGISPLAWAAINGHGAAVNLLLAQGAYIDIEDIKGQTPLLHAAKLGQVEVVKVLLGWWASTTISDYENKTAEAWARENGHETVMKLLAKRRVP